jgi:hypothetical protein
MSGLSCKKKIISVGCGVHIIYNCLQSALDCLPFNVRFATEMHEYFYIYTLLYKVQWICASAGLENAELLYVSTCVLSLGLTLKRILDIFNGLCSYIHSQEKCPLLFKELFKNPCSELCLPFFTDQISTFQKIITTCLETWHVSHRSYNVFASQKDNCAFHKRFFCVEATEVDNWTTTKLGYSIN